MIDIWNLSILCYNCLDHTNFFGFMNEISLTESTIAIISRNNNFIKIMQIKRENPLSFVIIVAESDSFFVLFCVCSCNVEKGSQRQECFPKCEQKIVSSVYVATLNLSHADIHNT